MQTYRCCCKRCFNKTRKKITDGFSKLFLYSPANLSIQQYLTQKKKYEIYYNQYINLQFTCLKPVEILGTLSKKKICTTISQRYSTPEDYPIQQKESSATPLYNKGQWMKLGPCAVGGTKV